MAAIPAIYINENPNVPLYVFEVAADETRARACTVQEWRDIEKERANQSPFYLN